LALGLGVDPNHLAFIPDLVNELIEVPTVGGGNGNTVREAADDV